MIRVESKNMKNYNRDHRHHEQGTATIIAVLILGLVSIFVALALSRVTTEANVMKNDELNASTFYAAQASLETMTRTFNKVFAKSLAPTAAELAVVETTNPKNLQVLVGGVSVPSGEFNDYTFNQRVVQFGTVKTNEPIGGGEFENLNAKRTPYVLTTTATHTPSGVSVTLSRNFISNLIPIYQFGVFYDGDMEFYPGPTLSFGGRVHTNGDLYLMGRDGLRFTNKVTAVGAIVTSVARNGKPYDNAAGSEFKDLVYVDKLSNTPWQLKNFMGSVTGGPSALGTSTDGIPDGTPNTGWGGAGGYKDQFNGNLSDGAPKLKLPIDVGASTVPANIELIKRGRSAGDYEYEQRVALGHPTTQVDSLNLKSARFYNKPGLRITLADRKEKLPGCYNTATATAVVTPCGRRLDGASDGLGTDADLDGTRGYQPVAMSGGAYRAKRINGHRLYTNQNFTDSGMGNVANTRQTWVKAEVVPNSTSAPVDVTEDLLSLGLTDLNPAGANVGDARAILKMQRYELPGPSPSVATPTSLVGQPDQTIIHNNEMIDLLASSPTLPTGPPFTSSSFSVRYKGYLQVPSDGTYTITTQSKGGVRVYLKEQGTTPYPEIPVIDQWGIHASQVDNGTISMLSSKLYEMRIEYRNTTPTPELKLSWTLPGGTVESPIPALHFFSTPNLAGANKLIGEYFNTTNLNAKDVSTYDSTKNMSYISASNNFVFPNESAFGVSAPGITGTPFVIPFPIEMFDTREGLYNDDALSSDLENTTYPNTVPWNGVMSMIDIDMANLRTFFNGTWDPEFTAPGNILRSSLIPNNNGRIIYISDRRGDRDFDGEFDMEDIYGTLANPNNGTLDRGEDSNFNGILDADYNWEGSKYLEQAGWPRATEPFVWQPTATTNRDLAAFFDHKYYRRGIRLINGSLLPGNSTTGLTIASENGVYIKGNYNATGVVDHNDQPTPPSKYLPDANGGQVPASIVADAVTILSNAWKDGRSFALPFNILTLSPDSRLNLATSSSDETSVRVALFVGSTISTQYFDYTPPSTYSDPGLPSQGGGAYRRLNGGVHNLMRHLERWAGSNSYLNYCGSLINMFNSRNNIGSYKYQGYHVYGAPKRNYVFDISFTDNTRLPPGTPYVQHAQVTGFRLFTE